MAQLVNLSEKDAVELNALISDSFEYTVGHTFFDDFPLWDLRLKAPHVKSFAYRDEKQILSHVGARISKVQCDDKLISVGMLGGVSTLKSHRGQGLSSKLIIEAIKWTEAQNVDFTLLWGSEHEFYSKFGFSLMGEQFRFPLDFLIDSESIGFGVKTGFTDKILNYLVERKTGVLATNDDKLWISAHKTIQWYYVNEPFAFVGFQKGKDLPHMVHEFGGTASSLTEICANILSKDPYAEILCSRTDLKRFNIDPKLVFPESLCLAKPRLPDAIWPSSLWVSGIHAV